MNRIKRSVRFYLHYVNKTDTVTLAYYFILGIVPMITLMMGMCSYFKINTIMITNTLRMVLPEIISNQIISIFFARNTSMVSWLTIAISVYVSSKGTYRMILAVDKMYHIRQEMSFLSLQIHAIFDIFLIMALFASTLIGFGSLPEIYSQAGIIHYKELTNVSLFVMIYLMLLIVFKTVPSIRIRFRDCLLGALCTEVLFVGIVIFYKVYLMFANPTNVYGSIAGFAFLLMSVEYFCQAIYFGFAVNALMYIE